jgi:hypothetical protein
MDHTKFQTLIKNIYDAVAELEKMFNGRHFTPDGHMVGSIGECLVADAYNLKLMPAGNEGYDAITIQGIKVEIKATQSKKVAFRSCPEHAIVIQILPDGSFREFYNGPGNKIWKCFEGRQMPKNGQHQISLAQLKALDDSLAESEKIPKII